MTEQELELFHKMDNTNPVISASELSDKTPRTLLYGWNLDGGGVVHVYLESDGTIRALTYRQGRVGDKPELINHEFGYTVEIKKIVPTKRSYPELSDFEFCKLIKSKGGHVSITIFGSLGENSKPLKYEAFLD